MKHSIMLIALGITLLFGSALTAETTEKAKPMVTFLELGSANCIPCKMMQPVMKEVEKHYGEKIEVIFYDIALPKYRHVAMKHKVRVMPTQVFLDEDGKEFFRHEGFFPKAEILKVVDKHLAAFKK